MNPVSTSDSIINYSISPSIHEVSSSLLQIRHVRIPPPSSVCKREQLLYINRPQLLSIIDNNQDLRIVIEQDLATSSARIDDASARIAHRNNMRKFWRINTNERIDSRRHATRSGICQHCILGTGSPSEVKDVDASKDAAVRAQSCASDRVIGYFDDA